MTISTGYTKYQPCTLAEARAYAGAAAKSVPAQRLYVVGQLLVTEARTYRMSDTWLEGEALARKLGVQTVDAAGELYWPRHPVVAWVGRLWQRIRGKRIP